MKNYVFVLVFFVSGCTLLATCKNEVVESNITRVKQDNKTLARHEVKLKNTDAEEGWFTVIYEFSSEGATTLANSRQLIKAGETGAFTFVLDTAGEDVKGAVTFTQSDPVMKYSVKVNYRAVTKYRTETENVTKEVCK